MRIPRTLWLGVLVLTLVIVPFVLFGDRIEAWAHAALLGHRPTGPLPPLLCIVLLASDVVLPVPSSLVSAAAGLWWGPWLGALVSTVGMTLGSWIGYELGRRATAVQRWIGPAEAERLSRLFARHGEWIIVILRPLPVLAEAAAVFAGFSRMERGRYYALSIAANAAVSLFYGVAGSLVGSATPNVSIAALLGLLAVMAITWTIARRRARAD